MSNTKLTRLAGDVEAYDASIMPQGTDIVVPVGTVTRSGPDSYEFVSTQSEAGKPLRVTMDASNFEELDKAFAQRFSVAKMDDIQDNLTADTMHGAAEAAFMVMNTLASRTDSMAGYIQALSCAVATVMAEDVKDPDAFLEMFIAQTRELARAQRQANDTRKKLQGIVSSFVETMKSRSDDEDTTKH